MTQQNEFKKALDDVKLRQGRICMEAAQHVFAAQLSNGKPFPLSDGRWARTVRFIDPVIDEDTDRVKFGFDIKIYATKEDAECGKSTGELEFMCRNTGFGGLVYEK